MTGGESGKLRTAPVQEATVDQLAACACGVDGGADLRIADLPQSNAPGFLVQCCDGKDRLPLPELIGGMGDRALGRHRMLRASLRPGDRKSTRLNSRHSCAPRMPSTS